MDLIKSRSHMTHLKVGDLLHILSNLLLAGLVFLLVAVWQLYTLAFILIILSKWRIFAVQPRFWFANIIANLVDIIVGLSILVFMYQVQRAGGSVSVQVFWAIFYAIWLVYIKPQSSTRFVSLQATLGQALGITALFWFADSVPDILIVLGTWVVTYASARHMVSAYEEDLVDLLSAVWALFGAELAWLFNRWLVVYEIIGHSLIIPQITIVLVIVGYAAGHLYDAAKKGKLSKQILRYTFGFAGVLLILALTVFANWTGTI
jgi:hypothetical protein